MSRLFNFKLVDQGIEIQLTHDGLLFNLSHLYHAYYSAHYDTVQIAVRSFLVSPVMRGALALLRKESDPSDLILVKRDDTDIYLHTGFLSLALINLKLLDVDSVTIFHRKMRDSVVNMTKLFYSRDRRMIVPVSELNIKNLSIYGNIAERIICLARSGKISVGGYKPVEPIPWLTCDEELYRIKPSSPRTKSALLCLSAISENPLLMDPTMIVDTALHTIYLSLDSFLAKKSHCRD